MGVGMIAAGMIFLFNPFVNIVDVLPDFIGYALIIFGLTKTSFLDERLKDARRGMSIMLLISVIKTALLTLLPRVDSTMVLLFAFSFFVAESIFAIPAFLNLYRGFVGLGEIYGGTSIFYIRRRQLSAKTVRLRGIDPDSPEAFVTQSGVGGLMALTNIFIILRGVMSFLPELTALQSPNSVRYESWSYFNWIFRSASVIFLLPLAIIWARAAYKYFTGIKHDGVFIDTITEKYDREVRPHTGMLCACHMKSVYCLIIAVAVASGNFYIDYVNILPSFVSAVGFAAVIAMIWSYLHGRAERVMAICTLVLSGLRAAGGVCSYVFQSAYAAEYKPEYFLYVSGAHGKYLPIIITSTVEGVLGVAALVIIVALLRRMYLRHTEFVGELAISAEGAAAVAEEAVTKSRLPFALCLTMTAISLAMFAAHPIASLYVEVWTLLESVAFLASVASTVYLEDRIGTLLYNDLAESR